MNIQKEKVILIVLAILILQEVRSDGDCPKQNEILNLDGETCISSDECVGVRHNDRCLSSCPEDLLIEQQNGVNKCVKLCSPQNRILKLEGQNKIYCQDYCNEKLSSDGKFCIDDCNMYLEVEQDGKCKKCKSGVYRKLDLDTYQVSCVPDNNDISSIEERLITLRNDASNVFLLFKDFYNEFSEQIQLLLSLMEQKNLMKQKMYYFSQIMFSIYTRQRYELTSTPLVFKSDQVKIVYEHIEILQPFEYNTSFSLSKLKSDKPDDLKTPKKTEFRNLEFFPKSIFIVISEKNYLCEDSYYPNQCFKDIEFVQIYYKRRDYEVDTIDPEFSILFNNIDSNHINHYICLTTKDGIMTQSLNTQIINNPVGVKCTFKDNVSLFLDSQGIFNQKKCTTQRPYKLQGQCVSTCPNDLFDPLTNECISNLEECSFINEGGNKCVVQCSEDYPYLFKQSKYTTVCMANCNLYSYQQSGQKICTSQCLQTQIVDKQAKMCYNQKKECLKFVSFKGDQCIQKCGDGQDYQYSELIDGYQQCRICRNIIKEENQTNKCVTECNQDEMIYLFDIVNMLRRCVKKDFCSKKMISSKKESNICSDKCIKPEINYDNKCVESCPEGWFLSPSDNSCTKKCDGFYTSDEKLCVTSCGQVFEIVDDSIKDKKKCKKCDSSKYLSTTTEEYSVSKSSCKLIQSTDKNLEAMKSDLVNKFEQSGTIQSVYESDAAQKVINSFATQIESKLQKISNKSEQTQQDLTTAKSAFQSVLDLAKSFILKVDSLILDKPVKVSTQEFMVTSQVAQPGKRFVTNFNSNDIISGSSTLLETDPDESSTKFIPQMLQVSYLKKSHFCADTKCKQFPSLFIVSYQSSKRILVESDGQQFEITYKITSEQEPEKLQCLSYSKDGTLERSKGEINNNEIKCKFEYSSALFYDEECEFVNNCKLNYVNDENDKLSGGEIAGIVIGVIVFIALIIFVIVYLIRRRIAKKKEIIMLLSINSVNQSQAINVTTTNV